MTADTAQTSLAELALLFLRLGTIAFGGPAAHIAMMQQEVVHRRRWLTEQEFLDLISACNLIPGPNSTELAIHIGHRQAGFPGLLVAGVCFIMPAALIVLGVAWAYVRYSQLPALGMVMAVVKPIIVVIVARAVFALAKSVLKGWFAITLCTVVFCACFFIPNELALLLAAGIVSLAVAWWRDRNEPGSRRGAAICLVVLGGLFAASLFIGTAGGGSQISAQPTLSNVFFYFARIGSVLYGSGYVLLAFLRTDLVSNWHWLTPSQLLDATAVGQFTPGPVFTTATFIGYLLGGLPGACVATLGIFVPAFFFVAISAPFIAKLRQSRLTSPILDGINAGSLALMAHVTLMLARDAIAPLLAP